MNNEDVTKEEVRKATSRINQEEDIEVNLLIDSVGTGTTRITKTVSSVTVRNSTLISILNTKKERIIPVTRIGNNRIFRNPVPDDTQVDYFLKNRKSDNGTHPSH